jgi:hypothetical protein
MTRARLSLNVDILPDAPLRAAPWRGDPDPRADIGRAAAETIRDTALKLAAKGAVTAETLMTATGCTRVVAGQALAHHHTHGRLLRTERGVYVLPGAASSAQHGRVALAQGIQATAQEGHADKADFFATKEPLPPARVPDFDAPLRRRRA